jgi:hypothetical protein
VRSRTLGRLLQPGDGEAQDPGNVHLRAADALGDLALDEVLLDAQPDHIPVAILEHRAELSPVGSRPSSWTLREGLTVHVLSRKYRRSSPRIVGTAKVEKALPRAGSQRSAAFTSPTRATCIRSSIGSDV